jgi:hypothetical protein
MTSGVFCFVTMLTDHFGAAAFWNTIGPAFEKKVITPAKSYDSPTVVTGIPILIVFPVAQVFAG